MMGPGRGPHLRALIKELELRREREANAEDDGLDLARDLDAAQVEQRAERHRQEREVGEPPLALQDGDR